MTPKQLEQLVYLQKKFIEDIALAHDVCSYGVRNQRAEMALHSYYGTSTRLLDAYTIQLQLIIDNLELPPCH